jgi:hypothetical protein
MSNSSEWQSGGRSRGSFAETRCDCGTDNRFRNNVLGTQFNKIALRDYLVGEPLGFRNVLLFQSAMQPFFAFVRMWE